MIEQSEMHIGRIVREKTEEDGRKVEWLAKKIHCKRSNVYKIFDRASIDTARLLSISLALKIDFFAYLSDFYQNIVSTENNIDATFLTMLYNEFHVGKLIRKRVEEDGRKVGWLARKIHCKQRNIYNIFDRSSIDTEQLLKISLVLKMDFFMYLSEFYLSMAGEVSLISHKTITKRDSY